jgi:hypothetical protein
LQAGAGALQNLVTRENGAWIRGCLLPSQLNFIEMGSFHGRIYVCGDTFDDLLDQACSRGRWKLKGLFEEIGFAH